jgi:hypothetical protein
MKDGFPDAADNILRFRTHRDSLVRKLVLTLIPSLAAYDTATFIEYHLRISMVHLLSLLEKPMDRQTGMSLQFPFGEVLLNLSSVCRHRPHGHSCQGRYATIFGGNNASHQVGLDKLFLYPVLNRIVQARPSSSKVGPPFQRRPRIYNNL